MSMRVLVTGGAGFIGSHIVDLLVNEGIKVRSLDNLHRFAHHARPDYLNPGAEYVWGDLRDPDSVGKALDGMDAVSHQAAIVGLGTDFGDVREYVEVNDSGTAVLLEKLWARDFSPKVVLAGSMVVYGEGGYECAAHGRQTPAPRQESRLAQGLFDPACPECGDPLNPVAVTEDAALAPKSVYAATKLHQEHLCDAYGRAAGAPVICLRYHNVYGPRMPFDTPYSGVASIFRSALEQGRRPQVFEDGLQIRDFVHVRDVAKANLLALKAPVELTGAFNVSSGSPRTVLEMADFLCTGFSQLELRPTVTGHFRSQDVRHVFASAERSERDLGFKAQVGFEEGMSEFIGAPLRHAPSIKRGAQS